MPSPVVISVTSLAARPTWQVGGAEGGATRGAPAASRERVVPTGELERVSRADGAARRRQSRRRRRRGAALGRSASVNTSGRSAALQHGAARPSVRHSRSEPRRPPRRSVNAAHDVDDPSRTVPSTRRRPSARPRHRAASTARRRRGEPRGLGGRRRASVDRLLVAAGAPGSAGQRRAATSLRDPRPGELDVARGRCRSRRSGDRCGPRRRRWSPTP